MIPNFGRGKNSSIRIFISSTFKDLQNEREILVRSVFPRLRSAFKDRSVEIIDVDLRWGLPEDLAESGKIIEICLGEVLRCKPFFMGIVGNRYGYEPNDYEIDHATSDLKSYVGRESLLGMSITEMEIRTGMNALLGKTEYSFYLKKGKDDDTKLSNLKAELLEHGAKYYDDLDTFEHLAYTILFEQINRTIPTLETPYGDDEYLSHLSLLNERTSNYVPMDSDTEMVGVVDANRYVHVYGTKGSGKTSRMAHLIEEFGVKRNGNVFFHFSGLGSDSGDLHAITERLRKFIASYVGEFDTVTDTDESRLKEILGIWPTNRQLYVFLDAIEKIKTKHNLELMLFRITEEQPSVHIICSSIEPVNESGIPEFEITPLRLSEKKHLLESYLHRYSKTLSQKQIDMIISNKSLDSPLMLRAVSNLLRVYGDYDTFNEYVKKLSSVTDLSEMYKLMRENVACILTNFRYDPEDVDRILCLLAYSYNGMRELDIGAILEIPTFSRIMVLQAFELFISDVRGNLRIDHDLISDCIMRMGHELEKSIRRSIIDYFKGGNDGPAYAELAYQYGELNQFEELTELLTRPMICRSLRDYDYYQLIRSFNLLKEKDSLPVMLRKNMKIGDLPVICPILVDSGCFSACVQLAETNLGMLNKHDELNVLNALARSQYKLGTDSFGRACLIYQKIIAEYRRNFSEDRLGMCEYLLKYGISCVSNGRVKGAIIAYEYIWKIFSEKGTDNYLSSWTAGNLASCYLRIGDIKRACSLYEYAMETRRMIFGDESPEVAWEICYYWSYLMKTGSIAKAELLAKKAVNIYRKTFGYNSVLNLRIV